MASGMIFDIQRYSIHDGPGIRTTVFLKDCPLRCRWCSNPESWGPSPRLFYLRSRCIGCLSCLAASRHGEVSLGNEEPVFHFEACTPDEARRLSQACPAGALLLKGSSVTAREIFRTVLRDLPFYQRSGGGMTLSGGEPLLQKEFACEILSLCRDAGIHTAVETTGFVPWETLEVVSPLTDLFLYDFKHPDSEIHRYWTGRPNEQILANLERLARTDAHIHVRVPVIPDVNDDPHTLRAIADFLDRNRIKERSLLPFHQYGSSKYLSLGLSYSMEKVPQLSAERLEQLARESDFYR